MKLSLSSPLVAVALVSTFAATGCDWVVDQLPAPDTIAPAKKAEATEKPASGVKAEAKADAKAEAKKLPNVGLTMDLPADAMLSEAIGGGGDMVMSTLAPLTVTVAKKGHTLEAAKSDASMFDPKNLKTEKLADGWLLTFENTGSMGTNYWMEMHRDIAGKGYKCDTATDSAAKRDAALAACKSLKP